MRIGSKSMFRRQYLCTIPSEMSHTRVSAADPDLPSGGYPVQRNKKRLIHNQSCLGAAFVSTWLNKQIFAVETKSPRGWHTQGDFGDHAAYTCSTVLHTARAIDLDLPSSCRAVPRGLVPGHPKHPLWIRH